MWVWRGYMWQHWQHTELRIEDVVLKHRWRLSASVDWEQWQCDTSIPAVLNHVYVVAYVHRASVHSCKGEKRSWQLICHPVVKAFYSLCSFQKVRKLWKKMCRQVFRNPPSANSNTIWDSRKSTPHLEPQTLSCVVVLKIISEVVLQKSNRLLHHCSLFVPFYNSWSKNVIPVKTFNGKMWEIFLFICFCVENLICMSCFWNY